MDPDPRVVSLFRAWSWTCPDCDVENYVQGVSMPEEEVEEVIRHEEGLEPWEELPEEFEGAEFVLAPTEVACRRCRKVFQTDAADEDEETEGDPDGNDEIPGIVNPFE